MNEEELYIKNQIIQRDAVVVHKSTGEEGLVLSQHCTFFGHGYCTVEFDTGQTRDIWVEDLMWVGRLD